MNATTSERPLALVTGASSGIGFELARQFAEHGFDLIIAAENGNLDDAASQLSRTGATLDPVKVDLAKPQGVQQLYEHVRASRRPLEAAALNAGIGAGGAFATDTDLDQELELIDLNVRSTVQLAKYLVRDMRARGAGRILFTSSLAATTPGPFHAVYNASKSFVQSFALGLRNELKDTGVVVTTLMPGATDTEFFERAGLEDTLMGSAPKDDPALVARQGFEALMAGDERVIAGSWVSKLQGRVNQLMPDAVKAQMHRAVTKPGSAEAAGSARRVLSRLGIATTASRSLPIRAAADRVEASWQAGRRAILDDLPAKSGRLTRGRDQGDWGTTWQLELKLNVPLPRRVAGALAGKAVRRLKALAETGELPSTAHNPSYRSDAGADERELTETS